MIRRLIGPLCVATVLAAGALTPAHAARPHASVSLTGAGSTFDLPFFTKAFEVYGGKHSVQVNYQGIGSGAGIQQFIAKTVDFGATDVPMDPTSDLPAAYCVPVALDDRGTITNTFAPLLPGGFQTDHYVDGATRLPAGRYLVTCC